METLIPGLPRKGEQIRGPLLDQAMENEETWPGKEDNEEAPQTSTWRQNQRGNSVTNPRVLAELVPQVPFRCQSIEVVRER